MPPPLLLRLVLSLPLFLFIPATARATSYPPGRTPQDSIELLVSNSSLIVRARIADVVSNSPRDHIRLAVLETIRGTPPPDGTILIEDYLDSARAVFDWREGRPKIELLVLIGAHVIRTGAGQLVYHETIPLDQPSAYGYATLNFEIINDPGRILAAVRQTASELPPPSKNSDHSCPPVFLAFNGSMTVRAPANQLLVDQARKWVSSPNHHLRLSAAEALPNLNAPDINRVMQRLLADPYADFRGYEISRIREFPIREAAAQWLSAHGTPFQPPVLAEPVFQSMGGGHYLGVAAIAALAVLVAVIAAWIVRRYLRWPLRPVLIIWYLLAIATVTAYVHTWRRVDEFWLGNPGSTRVVAVLSGRVIVLKLEAPVGPLRFISSSQQIGPAGLSHTSYRFETGLDERWKERATAKPVARMLPGVTSDTGLTHHPFSNGFGPLSYSRVAIPLWPVLLICLIPLTAAAHSAVRRRIRQRRGLCRHCGFDLRASNSICPECGTATMAAAKAETTSIASPPSPDLP